MLSGTAMIEIKHTSAQPKFPAVSILRSSLWLTATVYVFFLGSGFLEMWLNPGSFSDGPIAAIISTVLFVILISILSIICGLFAAPVAPYMFYEAVVSISAEVSEYVEAGIYCQRQGESYDVGFWYYVYAPGTLAVFAFIAFVALRRRLPVWVMIAFVLAGSFTWEKYLHHMVDQVRALPQNTSWCGG